MQIVERLTKKMIQSRIRSGELSGSSRPIVGISAKALATRPRRDTENQDRDRAMICEIRARSIQYWHNWIFCMRVESGR